MKKTIILWAVMAALVACDKGGEEPVVPEEPVTPGNPIVPEEQAIELVAEILPLSRTPQYDEEGGGRFAEDDRFVLTLSGEGMTTACRDYEVGRTELFWSDPVFASASGPVRFAGCYPVLPETDETVFTFDAARTSNADLLLAEGVSAEKNTENPVKLSFRHAMHRLKLVYRSEDDYTDEELKQMRTVCTAKSTCRVDLAAGQIVEVLGQTADFSAQGTEAVFVFPPQAARDVTLAVEIGEETRTFQLDAWLEENGLPSSSLEGGRELTLTVSVSRQEITIDGSEIGGWGNQGEIEGELTTK